MDRREFITRTATGLGLFTILPAATTYTRLWKAVFTIKTIPVINRNRDDVLEHFLYSDPPKRYICNAQGQWVYVPPNLTYYFFRHKFVPITLQNPDPTYA